MFLLLSIGKCSLLVPKKKFSLIPIYANVSHVIFMVKFLNKKLFLKILFFSSQFLKILIHTLILGHPAGRTVFKSYGN